MPSSREVLYRADTEEKLAPDLQERRRTGGECLFPVGDERLDAYFTISRRLGDPNPTQGALKCRTAGQHDPNSGTRQRNRHGRPNLL